MITVYTKPDCQYCNRAKDWLDHNDLEYQTVDVTIDDNALAFLKSRSHKTVPQLYAGDKLIVEGGFTGLARITKAEILARSGPYTL